MTASLLLIVIMIGAIDYKPPSFVDVVTITEVNHYYDTNGRIIFDQIIYWDWSIADNRYNIVDWRILKNSRKKLTEKEYRELSEKQPILKMIGGSAVRAPVVPDFLWDSPIIPSLHTNGMYQATWFDGDVIRTVKSFQFRETWTQYDPELENRNFLPKEYRRLLKRKPEKTGSK